MRRIALTLSAAALALAGSVSALSAHQARGPMMQDGGSGHTFDPQYMGPGMMMGAGMMGHGMRHMMAVMMDADGDGAVSLEEFQAVQLRMFKAMDLDNDGKLTSEEMEDFMWSGGDSDDN
jgi:hypothetical protein